MSRLKLIVSNFLKFLNCFVVSAGLKEEENETWQQTAKWSEMPGSCKEKLVMRLLSFLVMRRSRV